ncbi:FAD-binding protein [Sphingobium sp. AN558]|uniref:FAD-binding protein n=1 Tax=Sphingobium sp. AN558 TaxID=3133442 RepID=UPI0030BCCB72
MFKAERIADLAREIDVAATAFEGTIACVNDYARTGKDVEFGRGATVYDRTFGNPNVRLNSCLGFIDKAPFYAILVHLVHLGDLGTMGVLRTHAQARVLDLEDRSIPGLYAGGNAPGTPFGSCYLGTGGDRTGDDVRVYCGRSHGSGAIGLRA